MLGFVEGVSYWRRRRLLEMGQGQRAGVTSMRNAALTTPHGRFKGCRQGSVRLEVRAANHDIKPASTPSDRRRQIDFRSSQHRPRWTRHALGLVDGRRRNGCNWDRNNSVGHQNILLSTSSAEKREMLSFDYSCTGSTFAAIVGGWVP